MVQQTLQTHPSPLPLANYLGYHSGILPSPAWSSPSYIIFIITNCILTAPSNAPRSHSFSHVPPILDRSPPQTAARQPITGRVQPPCLPLPPLVERLWPPPARPASTSTSNDSSTLPTLSSALVAFRAALTNGATYNGLGWRAAPVSSPLSALSQITRQLQH